MKGHLAIVERRAGDAGEGALRALAAALVPYLRELLRAERCDEELVDVAAVVPLPRRAIMRACRAGRIPGAVRVARRWLASRGAVAAWLREVGPRPVRAQADDLEDLRRSLARGGRRQAR